MVKDDEKLFLFTIYKSQLKPREIINGPNFNINHKRAWYLLNKWSENGLYEYGVSLDLGWLTDKGIELAKGLL